MSLQAAWPHWWAETTCLQGKRKPHLCWGQQGDPAENQFELEVKKVTGSFLKAHWLSEAWGSGCPSQGVSCVDSRRSYPWQPGCSCHCSGTFYLHFEPCSHFDILHAQVTLVAWYQLRQEHIMAMAEMIEDQDVIVRVTLLHIYDPTTLVVSFEWQHCSNLPPVFRRITGHLKLRLLRGVGAWR